MTNDQWIDVGSVEELGRVRLQEVRVGKKLVALSCKDGVFGAVSGVCNHVGGPLGRGTLEGFYSKNARACTWPCSITQMDPMDQMEQVYEGIVHGADVILVATPIRWGAASSLYYKMVERMNCVQNAITTHNKVLVRDKSVAFIITGGQDNVQAVAGQMLGFFAEIGCHFPPFPYVAHSRGWSAEDMERNMEVVRSSEELRAGTRALVDRAVDLARRLRASRGDVASIERGGRKAHAERGGEHDMEHAHP